MPKTLDDYEDCDDVVLDAILKSRFLDEAELWTRFQAICDRLQVFAIPEQLRQSLKRLRSAGKITYTKGKGVKRA